MLRTILIALIMASFLFIHELANADSLELQQMKDMISQMEAKGVAVPPMMYDTVRKFEKDEARNGGVNDSDNRYGKSVSEMNCTDDISGTWRTSGGLTVMNLSRGGSATLRTDDATGQYYTDASFEWSASSQGFTASYDYVNTYDKRTGEQVRSKRPPTDTVKCRYSGTMLTIGGVVYNR